MSASDYYRILGVSPQSPFEEVRRQYRILARQHHPDRNPDDPGAAARFRLVVEAFEAIQAARSQARRRAAAGKYRQPRFTDRENLFEEFFGILHSASPLQQSAGADFRYDLEISLVDALRGMGTVITVAHHAHCRLCHGSGLAPATDYQQCPECQGRGHRFGGPGLLRFGPVCDRCQGRGKIVAQPCPRCDGNGHCLHAREYCLRIPPGTHDGARLRIQGGGGEGFRNGPPGNLEIVIHVAPDDFFTRIGNDIHCKIEVSFAEAALGGVIQIPTLKGFQSFNLPQGTQTGWTFRFPGAGAPGGPHLPAGDQVNEVVVSTPRHLSPRQKSLLEELARLEREQLEMAGHE